MESLASKSREDQDLRDPNGAVTSGESFSNGKMPVAAPPSPCASLPSTTQREYDDLSSKLITAWPSQTDIDVILNSRVLSSDQFQYFTCPLYLSNDTSTARTILQVPCQSAAPVQVARKLLLMASFLQRLQRCQPEDVGGLSINCRRTMMLRAVETAHSVVTSHDDLVTCIAGVECCLIESMYHNNMGDLSRAWLILRKAMLRGQLIGLHRGTAESEDGSQSSLSPDYLWFRLVQMDLYLSLMLGLRPDATSSCLDDSKVLQGCTPLEQMHRIQCVAMRRILDRNCQADMNDLKETIEIDKMLQKASSLMPPKWWLCPTDDASVDVTGPTHVSSLVAHHHLLLRLHLPYLLKYPTNRKYDYGKITAISSSREILSWYVFVKSKSSMPYCRGIDFLASISCTTLCIAHIEAQRQRQSCYGSNGTIFDLVANQRLSDRAMVERTLDVMDLMVEEDDDQIASSIAGILRPLLQVEANAASGGIYVIKASTETDHEDISDGDEALHVLVPCYGTITIAPCSPPRAESPIEVIEGKTNEVLSLRHDGNILTEISHGEGSSSASTEEQNDYGPITLPDEFWYSSSINYGCEAEDFASHLTESVNIWDTKNYHMAIWDAPIVYQQSGR